MDRPDQTTHFGFRDVPLGEKQTLVNEVFHSVASRYDLMNDLMSIGLHRVWKDIMITALNPPKSEAPFALLDVAGGTGDIAFRAAKAAGPGFRATVCDINTDMLGVGRNRAARALDQRVSLSRATPRRSPSQTLRRLYDRGGIRNVPRIDALPFTPIACCGPAAISSACVSAVAYPASTGCTICSFRGDPAFRPRRRDGDAGPIDISSIDRKFRANAFTEMITAVARKMAGACPGIVAPFGLAL
jgi:demethylmenaquinone methyltransferase/2-methoxy-6-polyprenyl-1,4-benzoquinol methylase